MKIKSMTAVFGMLDRSTLEPGPGLTVIHAPNEGGKSTWAAFWRAMLYGIDTRDRDKKGYLAEKNRWQPWSGAPMEGELDLEWQGRDISIYRGPGPRGNVPFGSFSAVYTGTRDPVPGLTAETCGEALTGVGREVFQRSAFLGGDLSVTPAPELERRIAALASSGEEGVSFSQAAERLRGWLNRRRVNRSVGLIPKLEESLRQAEESLSALEEVTAQIDALDAQRSALEQEKKDLEWDLHVHQRLRQRDLNARFAQAGRELEEAQARLDALEAEAGKYGPLPPLEELKRAQGELQYIKVLEDDARQAAAAAQEAEEAAGEAKKAAREGPFGEQSAGDALRQAEEEQSAYRDKLARAGKRGRRGRLWLVLALVLLAGGGIAAFALPQYRILAAAAGGAGALVCLILSLSARSGKKRLEQEAGALLERWGITAPEELSQLAQAHAARCAAADEAAVQERTVRTALSDSRAKKEAAQEELLNFVHTFSPDVSSVFGCSAAISRALSLEHDLTVARSQTAERRKRRDDLAAQGGRDWDTLELLRAPERSREETERLLEDTVRRLEQVNEDLNQALGRQQAMGDPAALWANREELTAKLSRRRREYDAVQMALDTLSQANTQLRERFSPELNRAAGAYLSRLTGERWTGLTLNRALEGAAAREGDLSPHSALTLSRGTVDQLYLAVRLAVCRLCLPERPPLLLDDALLAFDDERLGLALDLLRELAEEQQVLLFTCQEREGRTLAGAEGVTLLELP